MNTNSVTLASDASTDGTSSSTQKNTNGLTNEANTSSGPSFARVLAKQTQEDESARSGAVAENPEEASPFMPSKERQEIAAQDTSVAWVSAPWAALMTSLESGGASGSPAHSPEGLGVKAVDPPLLGVPTLSPRDGSYMGSSLTPNPDASAGLDLSALRGSAAAGTAPPWVATPLGHGLTIISAPQEPAAESLNAFALSQGLDPATVTWLLSGQRPAFASTMDRKTDGMSGSLATGLDGIMSQGLQQITSSDQQTASSGGSSKPTIATLDVSQVLGDEGADWLTSMGWMKNGRAQWASSAATEGLRALDAVSATGDAAGSELIGATQALWRDGDANVASGQGHSASLGTPVKPETTPHASSREAMHLSGALLTGQELADKMNEAIGKRLLQAVERGEWQLKLQLKPAELGHIDVDLKVKGHVLEASFTAQQGLTRDLLEAGSGRLKDTLTQSGMDVASMKFNDGQSARFGGDSTPRHSSSGPQQGSRRTDATEVKTDPLFTPPEVRAARPGGLDLMV